MLILGNDDIRRLLPIGACLEVVEDAWRSVGLGKGLSTPRINLAVTVNENKEYVLKRWDGALSFRGVAGTRLTSSVLAIHQSDQRAVGQPVVTDVGGFTGLILLFSTATGEPIALMHDAYLSRIAASSSAALAVKWLARSSADTLAMLGAGRQARTQVPLIASVRALREVRIFHPVPKVRERFALELRAQLDLAAYPVATPQQAVEGAAVVSTASSSPFHVFETEWLAEGCHVSLSRPSEAPANLFAQADLLVTAGQERPITVAEQGTGRLWTQRPAAPPSVTTDRIVTLDQVIAGRVCGRTVEQHTSVYGAITGHLPGVLFIALAAETVARAEREDMVRRVPNEWLLQDEVS
jgi:ornithine cyclodeaminase/alanine dehydrogenase-like protein (mu-crystallin family)